MTPSIDESWIRIEAWLAEHAPVTFAGLEPPAAPAAIAAAEAAVGLPFPDALRQSLLRHNGTGYQVLLPDLWQLMDVQDIPRVWAMRTKIHEAHSEATDGDPEGEYGPWWHRQYIPFAADGLGGELVLDQRPSALRGRVGCAYKDSDCVFSRELLWGSLPTLLAATATALETGDPIDSYRRTVTGEGELDWEVLP
ncbi:SMI1/KNR4 family protein [Streptacidiphilus sp. P02-A3a]|uniref:SMI1/KNR4 family protein n=1 Tax=Streptacidiphilus sp. P02-A3a TaxID=2704468 RepID=UPI0015FB1F06|nr:SMI1/KNR4 family protein [Streptacidiphilus sp. P02-A3a]QMU69601.1 SMI1/KNR4 family protein [Streptacidiphilus sp. P02-A3a]